MAKLKITQVRSTISRLPKHRRTIKALGWDGSENRHS